MRTRAMTLCRLGLGALLALGCVNRVETHPTGEDESFILHSGNTLTEVRISGHEISGPDIQLSYTSEGIRGRAFGRLVDLQWSDTKVTGFFGEGRVDLTITPEPEQGVVVRGLYGSNLGEIAIRPTGVEGSLGACSYQLKTAAPGSGSFEGRRACWNSLPEQAALQIPESLSRRSAGEVVAILAVLMGR